ncbi:alpha/beta hydrolase [uncultured Roseobacter sp.]|uniref:alpha/beta hydrolase n=1 Tax=uncultured Roseobacter sp. TaxID=114847 RepID=UPI002634EC3F|nr:alpha/beta hydrolase [uncultured Roseobacter sp.]
MTRPRGSRLKRILTAGVLVLLVVMSAVVFLLWKPVPDYFPDDLIATDLSEPPLWQDCAWDPLARDRLAECARISVPLDRSVPSEDQIDLLVKRRLPAGNTTAQIWLVHGGPGASATAGMPDLSAGVEELRPDIAYYAVDHRGVGGSERLGCAGQEAAGSPGGALIVPSEWPDCIRAVRNDQGSRLAHFSTKASALDLDALVRKFREPEVPVFVYGGSYGTHLVRRYLQLTQHPPAGAVLEGLVASDGGMTGYDANLEAGALAFLDKCDGSISCSRYFDSPLQDQISRMFTELEAGHCGFLNLSPDVARRLLAAMTFFADTRVLIPPLVHRIRRCSWRDIWFVSRLVLNFSAATRNGTFSAVLHNHVVLSEMYRPGQSAARLQADFESAVLSTGAEAEYARLHPTWPKYDPPVPDTALTEAGKAPVLVLHGALDAPAPLDAARLAAQQLQIENGWLAVFPQGAHGVLGATPTAQGTDCARQIMLAFIDRPDLAPDMGCIDDVLPLDWTHVPQGAARLAGTSDLWGGPVR